MESEGAIIEFKVDECDLAIIRNLWDGRTPYEVVAKKVGLTTNTVRNRVKKMLESGVLQIISLVNPNTIENHQAAFIGCRVLPQNAEEAFKVISSLVGVVMAVSVSGRFDIMTVVIFNTEHTYQNFIKNELNKVEGLLSSETFFIIEGNTFQVRYVL